MIYSCNLQEVGAHCQILPDFFLFLRSSKYEVQQGSLLGSVPKDPVSFSFIPLLMNAKCVNLLKDNATLNITFWSEL